MSTAVLSMAIVVIVTDAIAVAGLLIANWRGHRAVTAARAASRPSARH